MISHFFTRPFLYNYVFCPNMKKLSIKKIKYSLQGTTQGRYLTGGVPPVRFSM